MNRYYIKLYYLFWELFLRKTELRLPIELQNKKNLFIYFDYEREFGGHKTKINDNDVVRILDLLDKYSFKSTWFTVGKIFKDYPNSIKAILERGHEIGSHTFAHSILLNQTKRFLCADFEAFNEVAIRSSISVKGFHSPQNKWSIKTIKLFKNRNFKYDVVGVKKTNSPKVSLITHFAGYPFIRFDSIGDDWSLFGHECSEEKSLEHFKSHFLRLNSGQIGGIGFHPWLLVSDEGIMKGFEKFLKYLDQEKDSLVMPIIEYYSLVNKNYKL